MHAVFTQRSAACSVVRNRLCTAVILCEGHIFGGSTGQQLHATPELAVAVVQRIVDEIRSSHAKQLSDLAASDMCCNGCNECNRPELSWQTDVPIQLFSLIGELLLSLFTCPCFLHTPFLTLTNSGVLEVPVCSILSTCRFVATLSQRAIVQSGGRSILCDGHQ